MPGRGTTNALFVVRRMQEEYRVKKKKLCMCFVDIEKAFDRTQEASDALSKLQTVTLFRPIRSLH